MEKAEVKAIGDYLKEVEEGIYGGDYDYIGMQAILPDIYETIQVLIDATFKTKDQELKPVLAYMELRLRKCKDYIEQRLAVRN
jgi:hypothetical protein